MNRAAYLLVLLPALALASDSASIETRTDGRSATVVTTAEADLFQASPYSIAAGFDVRHDFGTPYVELRYQDHPWSTYVGWDHRDGPRFGADLTWYEHGLFSSALGVTYATPDEEVGTRLRYEIRLAWQLSRRYALELVHESNCSAVCRLLHLPLPRGPTDKPNDGQNWLVLRYRLY